MAEAENQRAEELNAMLQGLHQQLRQACATELNQRANNLLELRFSIEVLDININAILAALSVTKIVEQEKLMVTVLNLTHQRVLQLNAESKKIVIARPRPPH